MALVLIGLLVATLAPLSPAKADHHTPWNQPGSAWQGTIQTTIHVADYNEEGAGYTRDVTSANYSNLAPLGSNANGDYAAAISTSGHEEWPGSTCPSGAPNRDSIDWSDSLPQNEHVALRLRTDDSGLSYFTPATVQYFDGTWTSTCTEDGVPSVTPHSVSGTYIGFGLQFFQEDSQSPLVDTDPDPLHLVGQRTWTVGDWPITPDNPPDEYTFTATYDLNLVPGTDSCDDEGTEARYTAVDGKGSVVLAGLPDPDLATVSFGVDWCLTDAGARVDKVPAKYVIPSDNWFLLGALESLGFEMDYPGAPRIQKRLRNVRATALVGMRLSPAQVILSFAPTTRLLEKVTERLNAALRRIKRTNSEALVAEILRDFEQALIKQVREWKVAFREKLNRKIRQWHPGTRTQKNRMIDFFNRLTEETCDFFEDRIMFYTKPAQQQAALENTKAVVGAVFDWVFSRYKVPIWDVDATLFLADNGDTNLSDSSQGRNIFTVKADWTTSTTP